MVLEAATYYLHSLINMAEASINDLLLEGPYDPPKSDVKRQKLIQCALTRNGKQYLGKACTKEQVNKLSAEEVDKLFSNYEANLSGQMVNSLDSMGACAVFGMSNLDLLGEDRPTPKLHSPEVHVRTLLHIRFVSRTPNHWTDY